MTERAFDYIADEPDYSERYKTKLAQLYAVGKRLAQECPDESVPLYDAQPDGPRCYRVILTQEALTLADFPGDYIGAEIVYIDEYEQDGEMGGDVVTLELSRTNEVVIQDTQTIPPIEQSMTIVTSNFYSIYAPDSVPPESSIEGNFDSWPQEAFVAHSDLAGNVVAPTFDEPATPLTSARNSIEIDHYGGHMLVDLIKAEAKIRHVPL